MVTTTGESQTCQSCLSYLKDTFATICVTSWHQRGYCINSNLGLESRSPLTQLWYDLLTSVYWIWTRKMLLAWWWLTTKKAFDFVDHTLLLQKLRATGIDNDYVSLFKSYLSDRTQYVNIDGCHSTLRDANLGVPQGSILGPVLFPLFINDLSKILEHSTADIYADDTTVSANVDYRSAPGALNQVLQADVGKVAQWTPCTQ